MKRLLKNFLAAALATSMAGAVLAAMLPEPTGPVILSVTGSIEETNGENAARFDRDMLSKMDWRTIESYTTWTEGAVTFAGVPLATVLDAVGAEGHEIIATALNEYSVHIPFDDAVAHDVLLAIQMNGNDMRIRDKGPIWIIYPQTQEASDEGAFDEKMIWQLKSLEIIE